MLNNKLAHAVVGYGNSKLFENAVDSIRRFDKKSPIYVVVTGNPKFLGLNKFLDFEYAESYKIKKYLKEKYKLKNIFFFEIKAKKKKLKTGNLYDGYNLVFKKCYTKGIRFLNLIQSDMQLMYFDKQILSLYKSIFDQYKKILLLSTSFPSWWTHPSFYRTKKKQEFFFKKKLFYKFFIDKSLGISDTGIFDLKKVKIKWEVDETYMSKKYKLKGYTLGFSPKFISAFIPWPPLSRKSINENNFKIKNDQILSIKNFSYYFNNTKKLVWYENMIFSKNWNALQPYSFTDLDMKNFFINIIKFRNNKHKKIKYISNSHELSFIEGFFLLNSRPNIYYVIKKLFIYFPIRLIKKIFKLNG